MILRWAGGKRWLYQHIEGLIPNKIQNYVEPFVGGGSFFFKVQNKSYFTDSKYCLTVVGKCTLLGVPRYIDLHTEKHIPVHAIRLSD